MSQCIENEESPLSFFCWSLIRRQSTDIVSAFRTIFRIVLTGIWIVASLTLHPQSSRAAPTESSSAEFHQNTKTTSRPEAKETWLPPSQENRSSDSNSQNHQAPPLSNQQPTYDSHRPTQQPSSKKRPRLGLAITGTAIAGGGLLLVGASGIALSEISSGGDTLAPGLLLSAALISGVMTLIGGGIMALVGWTRYNRAKSQMKQQGRLNYPTAIPMHTWIRHRQ